MTIIVQDRAINLPSGLRQVPAENVPDGLERFYITLKRCTAATPSFWPNASTVLNVDAFLSIDGGPFRLFKFAHGCPGGIETEGGVEQPLWWFGGTLWPGVNRQIRFEIEVINGPLVSEVGLEAR